MRIDLPLSQEYENFLQYSLGTQYFVENYLYSEIHKLLLMLADFLVFTKNIIGHFKIQNLAIFYEGSTNFIVETFVAPAC